MAQERQALLRGIIADSENIARRGVFADWLDEHDQDNGFKEHAKLIRWQCAFSDHEPDESEILLAVTSQFSTPRCTIVANGVVSYYDSRHRLPIYLQFPAVVIVVKGFVISLNNLHDPWHWKAYGPSIVRLVPIEQVAISVSFTPGLRRTDNGIYTWLPTIPDRTDIRVPWIPENNNAYHNTLQAAKAWYSRRAIKWAKKQKVQYD